MNIDVSVAYRVYTLGNEKNAILFNIVKKEYMFLAGLSAELFEQLLASADSVPDGWLFDHDLTEHDVNYFVSALRNFGAFGQISSSSTVSGQSDAEDDEKISQYKYELNNFQNKLRKNGLYYAFHFDITNRCNENCVHCYHAFDCYDYSKELTTNQVKDLIDIVYSLGVFSITLSGGEALLRSDIFEILDYISAKGILITLFTNGMLLTESTVIKLRQYRIRLVSISVYSDIAEIHDSITMVPGSFSRTMRGIELLKQHRISFELKSVILRENVDRVDYIRELSRRLNNGRDCKLELSMCGKINGECSVYEHAASYEDLKRVYYSDPERFIGNISDWKRTATDPVCGAGKYSLYCSADGSIYPCVSFRLFICDYRDLPRIQDNVTLKRWLNTKLSDFSECFKHEYCEYCSGQCAGNNLIENGDYLNSNVTQCRSAKIVMGWFQSHPDNN